MALQRRRTRTKNIIYINILTAKIFKFEIIERIVKWYSECYLIWYYKYDSGF